ALLPRGRPPGAGHRGPDGLVLERPVAAAQGGGGGAGPRIPDRPGPQPARGDARAGGLRHRPRRGVRGPLERGGHARRPRLRRRAHHRLFRGQLADLELPGGEAGPDRDRGPAGRDTGGARGPHAAPGPGHDLPGRGHAHACGLARAVGSVHGVPSARGPALVSVRASAKADRFTESVIREMTRLAHVHGAVNLSQGFPDFAAPEEVKEAARRAVSSDINQYAITWGARSLREAIAAKFQSLYGVPVDPEREITVTCGSTEAIVASLLAVLDPGDEVVVFEPFYENYGPDAILSGAVPRYVKLRPPDWSFDPDELARAFGPKTRAIVVNT